MHGDIRYAAGEEGRPDVAEFKGLQGKFFFLTLGILFFVSLGVGGPLKGKQGTQGKKQYSSHRNWKVYIL
jgi:hypothetical protein